MDFRYLYSSTSGRISRKTFWWGAVGLAVSGAVVSLLLGIATIVLANSLVSDRFAATGVTSIGFLAINILFYYPAYCLAVKRRHDRNSRGWDLLGYLGANAAFLVAFVIVVANGTAGRLGFSPVMSWLGYGMQAYGLYMLVVLGFLKGTDGTNDYGPDPLTSGAAATA